LYLYYYVIHDNAAHLTSIWTAISFDVGAVFRINNIGLYGNDKFILKKTNAISYKKLAFISCDSVICAVGIFRVIKDFVINYDNRTGILRSNLWLINVSIEAVKIY